MCHREEIGKMFGDVGATLKSIRHDYPGKDTARYPWLAGAVAAEAAASA
jgi:hypothetical protein